jgi:hydroxyacylglutathione hydrolase/adenylyltransferase/sulfurtransferase
VSSGAEDLEISPARAAELLAAGEAQLVDVREAHEVQASRIPGARHVELERLAAQAETIGRDRPVIFQCAVGARSAMAAQAFRAAGYDAWSLAGGIRRWFEEGLPVEPRDGTAADH